MGVFFKVEGMVGPVNGGLQVAEDGIDSSETLHVRAFATLTNNFTLL